MTDLFYYDLKNKVKIRAEKVKADEYWVKDPDNPGEYIPLVPGGGGGGGELPFYAKPAKIDFLSDSLRATMDLTGIEVDNTGDGTGSMLSPIGLTIGDTNGNESITKDKAGCLTRVHALESAPEINTTADAVETRPVVFNPTTKEFRQTSNISLLSSGGTYRTSMVSSSFEVSRPTEPGWASSMAIGGFTTGSPTHRFHAASTGTGVVFRNLGTNKGVVMRDSYVRVANMNNDAVSASGDYGSLEEDNLRFRINGVSYIMNHDDIEVTNKLKSLSSTTPGSNSRMLIYDTATKVFSYTTIPEGGGGGSVGNTYTITIPPYSSGTSFLPRFTGDTITELDYPEVPSTLRRYLLNVGDTLLLKTIGASGDPACLFYNTWYCVAISKGAVNYSSAKYSASLVNVPIDGYTHSIDIASSPINRTAVPLGSILFRINAFNGTAKRSNSTPFFGAVAFRVLSYETSDSPAPTTV